MRARSERLDPPAAPGTAHRPVHRTAPQRPAAPGVMSEVRAALRPALVGDAGGGCPGLAGGLPSLPRSRDGAGTGRDGAEGVSSALPPEGAVLLGLSPWERWPCRAGLFGGGSITRGAGAGGLGCCWPWSPGSPRWLGSKASRHEVLPQPALQDGSRVGSTLLGMLLGILSGTRWLATAPGCMAGQGGL